MLMPSILGGRFFEDDWMEPFDSFQTSSMMNTDVEESDNAYMVTMDIPGVHKEDVHAELNDGYLTITASSNSSHDDKDEKGSYIRRERFLGTSTRSFYVGDNVTQDDIKAKFENGTLKLLIPKKEKAPNVENKHYIPIEG